MQILKAHARAFCHTCIVGIFPLLMPLSEAAAVAPDFVPDKKLAKAPVVVVAKWTGGPWTHHSLVDENALKAYECRTEISVERVIRGNVKPGKHLILVPMYVRWSKRNPLVFCYMSTEACGDANADVPNLWFLRHKRSWDKRDANVYLAIGSYRSVQPLELEPYFDSLQKNRLTQDIPALMASTSDLVVIRTLEQIAGDNRPWPFHVLEAVRPRRSAKAITEHAELVWSVATRHQSDNVRAFAAAVYLAVLSKAPVPRARQLLGDQSPEVRTVAIGELIDKEDTKSVSAMVKALEGIDAELLKYNLVERIEASKNEAFAPLLKMSREWKLPWPIREEWRRHRTPN